MFTTLLEQLANDTTGASLPRFVPEATLVVTIVAMLVARVAPALRRIDPFWIASLGAVAAIGAVAVESRHGLAGVLTVEVFDGMLRHDPLGVFGRGLLLTTLVLIVALAKLTGLATREDGQDLFVVLFGATLGMCLMCRANHLATVVLGIEMASVPSYVLAGIIKGRRRAGEAALKYAVYGAAAAGVLLYGVSLLLGLFGTAHLPTLGERLALVDPADPAQRGFVMALTLGGLLVLVGMAFKLSAAPFHFWAPDVFAGAPAEVGAFLSVASKSAALVLLVRLVTLTLPAPSLAQAPAEGAVTSLMVADAGVPTPHGPRDLVVGLLAAAAGLTCTVGNLAALRQQNAKRLLAYSTIAHAGYLLMPVAAAVALAGRDSSAADAALAATLVYLTGYLFLNFTAFAAVAAIRNARGTEELADYAGLVRTAPVTAVTLGIALLGLLGLPPLVGFYGKLSAFRALAEAGGPAMTALLVVAVVNTAVSVSYYLAVVKTLWLDAPTDAANHERPDRPTRALLILTAAPIVLIGLAPEGVVHAAGVACRGLFR